MNSRRILLIVLAAAALGALAWWRFDAAPPPAPLADSGIGGPFALIDQDGHMVTDRSWPGQYQLIYFGYTFCPDVCPLDTQKLGAALQAFEKADPARAAKVQPIFITVDPARDTPPALKQFVRAFHPRLVGLTGSEAQIDAVKTAFKVYAQRAGPAGAKDYLVDHTAIIYLMAPDGTPVSFVNHDATAADITAQLDRYVRR